MIYAVIYGKVIIQKREAFVLENSVSNNRAKVIGTMVEPIKFSHETYGESFYIFTVSVPRFSGTEDKIRVMAPGLLIIGNDYSVGDKVIIEGQFRSFNDMNEGKSRLVLTLFAKEMEVYASEYDEQNPNTIYLNGYVCKEPVYRTTPFGKEITDILVAVNRGFNKSDYIPVIAWNRNARYAQNLMVGDNIQIWGRMQSRTYYKTISETEKEERTAYEVSVNRMAINEPMRDEYSDGYC